MSLYCSKANDPALYKRGGGAYFPIMSKSSQSKLVAENRKARYNYTIEDTLECGIVLMGSEVKSLRAGGVNIAESYAGIEAGELWLINAHIPKYKQAKSFGHEERRHRKLLASRRELSRLFKEVERGGMTLVPLKLYFNEQGRAKLLIGLARGKKMHDKRDTEKRRDWGREKQRLLKRG